MFNLNLTDVEKSDIKFEISKFPDGQQTLNITDSRYIPIDAGVIIKSRLNNFKDLELIICANQALKNEGAISVSLYVPYFLGSRSDRKFQKGGVNYLKQVICPIINLQNFKQVITLDPHSDVLEACLNNYEKKDNIELVEFALKQIDSKDEYQFRTALISSDAGALKKIFDVAQYFGITNVTTASKVRDMITGNIVRTELPTMDLDGIEQFIIIDDICDGGRTFIELAKVIKQQTDKPIYLIVTHGIFSAGYTQLEEHIDGIFTTDSVKKYEYDSYAHKVLKEDYLKVLNIF
jgi:ribose-phosphate pyrophosphokinase